MRSTGLHFVLAAVFENVAFLFRKGNLTRISDVSSFYHGRCRKIGSCVTLCHREIFFRHCASRP
jgi:hypothetical protein